MLSSAVERRGEAVGFQGESEVSSDGDDVDSHPSFLTDRESNELTTDASDTDSTSRV